MSKKPNYGKAKEILSKTFVENAESLSEDQIEHLITKASQKIKEIKFEKEADERLAAARQIVKDLGSSYKAAAQYEKARIDFLLEKLADLQGTPIGEANQ